MKTIEEIKDEVAVFHSSGAYSNWKELQKDLYLDGFIMERYMHMVLNAWEKQQVSIAVEKALQACDKHISVYSNIDYNFISLSQQILEELKGGEKE